ncbi:UNVERIFIED_CONTAM: hypothetical protein PYX00_005280 [Menopon gallinae]|uniref:Uncharacterized protein n=1 Tax=Menopon gallinae TaxID=328185 RepID=A0AAW2HQL2_9NEOP
MADLEAVLADVSYLMAMEKSKCTPAARASKKIVLPDPRSHFLLLEMCFKRIGGNLHALITRRYNLRASWKPVVGSRQSLMLL